MKRKVLISAFFILFTFALINCQPISIDAGSIFSKTNQSNWITISYGKAIDKSILTHSGEKIGNVIQEIPSYDDDFKGLVQQYLEPYSILCHDVLLYNIKPDTPPLINILAHYPIGSEQPTWVDLFREGHFQLYYNPNLIRIFLKGDNPENSFEKYQSVIRLPIQELINSEHLSIKNIEVYVFNNNYAKTEIQVNIIPATSAIDDLDLSPKHRSIDLGSIEEFLNHGIALEAVEVSENNDIFFYGRSASDQTVAGQPVSISDIAVIYRSIFHYGYNAPYISLDTHEDNRYSKVNFGGHLENTRVGHVVLEADKLFKMLSTGIDPNTHEFVKSKITKYVPAFLTEDERRFLIEDTSPLFGFGATQQFLEDTNEGNTQIRYWFYPDEIGTVTDGSIGVVQKHQFLADAERMDVEVQLDKATRETIDHLNKYFPQYEKAENTYKELNTVGRMMALVNWMKEMNIDDRVELDDLLSVKLPAFSTPEKTKKMLAITAIVCPKYSHITNQNVRDYTKTYYLSHLLDKYSSSTSDDEFLEIADNYFSQVDIAELYPPYKKLKDQIDDYDRQINLKEKEIELLNKEIERKKDTLDEYSSNDVDQYNNLIDKYNRWLQGQELTIDIYNAKISGLKIMNIMSGTIFSIGGGISLDPREFKQTIINKDSPAIREIAKVKNQLKSVGNISKSGDWIRSNVTNGGSKINKLPDISWTLSKSENGSVKYTYRTDSGDSALVEFFKNLNYVQYNISMKAYNDIVKYSKEMNLIEVTHDVFPQEYKGEVSSDGKHIVFSR